MVLLNYCMKYRKKLCMEFWNQKTDLNETRAYFTQDVLDAKLEATKIISSLDIDGLLFYAALYL